MTRGKPLSDDLRIAILNMGMHLDIPNIVKVSGVKRRNVERIFADYRNKATVVRENMYKELRGRKGKLTPGNAKFLQALVRHSPDIYLTELQEILEDRLGVEIHESNIWKVLKRCGFTMKKLTRVALERSEDKRAAFRYQHGSCYTAEQTVFVDESSFDRHTSIRGKGWAFTGERAQRKCFFVRGRRYSMLPALAVDGMVHVKIVEGSFTTELFYEFIEGLLDQMQRFPNPKSVIVMDNARIHKHPDIQKLIESRGMRVMFLPPYSPDFNPIELAFSSIKAYVRKVGELGREDVNQSVDDTYVYIHLIEAAYSVTAQDAEHYFQHCGYL